MQPELVRDYEYAFAKVGFEKLSDKLDDFEIEIRKICRSTGIRKKGVMEDDLASTYVEYALILLIKQLKQMPPESKDVEVGLYYNPIDIMRYTSARSGLVYISKMAIFGRN